RLIWQNITDNPRGYIRSRIATYPHLFLNAFDSFTEINQSFGSLVESKNWGHIFIKLTLLSIFSVLPFVLALIGLLKVRSNTVMVLCSSVWVYTLIIHLPMWIEYRFWLPAVPFLIISASMGILLISQKAAAMRLARQPEAV